MKEKNIGFYVYTEQKKKLPLIMLDENKPGEQLLYMRLKSVWCKHHGHRLTETGRNFDQVW